MYGSCGPGQDTMRFYLTIIDATKNRKYTRRELSDILFDVSLRVLSSDSSGEVFNANKVSVGTWELRMGTLFLGRRDYESEEDLTCYTEIPEKY